ncbi:hypothetical protein EUA93_05050 [Nocardioides oleivorans]|uniref:EVE domain-containing protein n=1 Tax=Nocardioides oleivorans TaxID=273676 RepID=A0A4Q2S194_9ACTN|nr:hypothetical protein [Nocardioides oleivorans]RYB93783.1 hypothetical protein EUA93_05050 [Nocardioides oleivorans]
MTAPLAQAVTEGDLGAWVIKARGSEPSTQEHVRSGFVQASSWCVRRSYRTDLVRAGQPVLLWVSGREAAAPAGIHARGSTTGVVTGDRMPVRLESLPRPLLRSELAGHPALEALEVLRMPAGSNPSFVSRDQLVVLQELGLDLRCT